MEWLILVLLGLLTLPLGWMVLTSYRRRWGLRRLARRLQLHYEPAGQKHLPDEWGGIYLMQLGHSGRIFHHLYGHWAGLEVHAFDYHCEVGFSQRRTGRSYHILIWRIGVVLPDVVALQGDFFEPLGKFRRFRRCSSGAADFDRHFWLFAEQGEVVGKWLSAPLRRRLRECGNVNWEFNGCLLYTSPSPRDLSTSRMPSSA